MLLKPKHPNTSNVLFRAIFVLFQGALGATFEAPWVRQRPYGLVQIKLGHGQAFSVLVIVLCGKFHAFGLQGNMRVAGCFLQPHMFMVWIW